MRAPASHPAPAPDACSAISLAAHRPNRFWWWERNYSVCQGLRTLKSLSRSECMPASRFPVLRNEQFRLSETQIGKPCRCRELPKLIGAQRRQGTEKHSVGCTQHLNTKPRLMKAGSEQSGSSARSRLRSARFLSSSEVVH